MVHRVGVLGVGLMGERFLSAIDGDSRFTTVAAHDPREDRLSRMAERFAFSPEGTEAALLARDDLDLLYIASPPSRHVASALAGLERRLPLLLEKPLAASVEEAEHLVEMAESLSVPTAMHFPFATLPELARIEQELRDGAYGEVERLEISLHFSQWPRSWHHAGAWLMGAEEGGFLREVLSHFIFLGQRLLGPGEVLSVARIDGPEHEVSIAATLRIGSTAVLISGGVGGAAPDFNRWTLFGASRSVRLEDWRVFTTSEGEGWRSFEAAAPSGGVLDSVERMLCGEAHPLATLREGLEVTRVVETLRRSPSIGGASV